MQAPRLSLLQLEDEFLFRVLAAVTPKPFKAASLMAVCTRFFRVASAQATSLKLRSDSMPSPKILALLQSSAAVCSVDIKGCNETWPLTYVLPHLPHLECVEMQLNEDQIPLLPANLQQVRLESVSIGCWDERSALTRLQERREGGTVVIEELSFDDAEVPMPATFRSWGLPGVRTPIVERAEFSCENDVPACLWRLTSLTALTLCCRNMGNGLPGAVSHLSLLRELALLECDALSTLPGEIGRLAALTELQLSDCEAFETFPAEMTQLCALEVLLLDGLPSLTSLPPEIGQLPALKSVSVINCGLESLPPTISQLSSLTSLSLEDCCGLTVLPRDVTSLASLQSLEIVGDIPLRCPTGIHRIGPSLQTLRLSLPIGSRKLAALGTLQSLHTLEISLACLPSSCPPPFASFPALTSLTLRDCDDVLDFLADLKPFSKLQELCIHDACSLHSFPNGAETLTALKFLALTGAPFVRVPETIGALGALTSLWLLDCFGLDELPCSISRLSGLARLSLNGCSSIAELPEGLGTLSALTALDLSGCSALRSLPESVGKLAALCSLQLEDCCALERLPDSICGLTALEELNLGNCRALGPLPDGIGRLAARKDANFEDGDAPGLLPKGICEADLMAFLTGSQRFRLCDA